MSWDRILLMWSDLTLGGHIGPLAFHIKLPSCYAIIHESLVTKKRWNR